MVIETKFNIGDEVWVMKDNKVSQMKIWAMDIRYETDFDGQYVWGVRKNVEYIDFWGGRVSESDLFPTKEELLKSL